jgi:hypothetical protein
MRYKDEKSFLLINKLLNHKSAEKICQSLEESKDSKVTLAVIESKDEQNFINRYLYEVMKTVENAWIGITKEELKQNFKANNEAFVKYTNWAEGSPSPSGMKSYMNLKSPFSSIDINSRKNLDGLWEDVSCDNNNLVLCQRMQSWTLSQVQRILYDMNNKLNETNEKLNELNIKIGIL